MSIHGTNMASIFMHLYTPNQPLKVVTLIKISNDTLITYAVGSIEILVKDKICIGIKLNVINVVISA